MGNKIQNHHGRKNKARAENLVAILKSTAQKTGPVRNYEIRSSSHDAFKIIQTFVRLFYHSATSHNSVDTFCKGFLFFDIL